MSEVKTKAYVVVSVSTAGLMPGSKDLTVGCTIELTEKQAASRVNKVRLKDEVAAEASKAGRKSKLETEHKELTARVAELETANAALKTELDKFKAPA